MAGDTVRWQTVDSVPGLGENEVHVWCFKINRESEHLSTLLNYLSYEEKIRVERYKVGADRLRLINARGLLRKLLGGYLALPPSEIRFYTNEYGKPYLSDTSNKNPEFNISHSGELILMAFTRSTRVGIDIERTRAVKNPEKIITRFFSADESAYFLTCSEEIKQREFFRLWTAREAYSKAVGVGVGLPREQMPISLLAEGSQNRSEIKDNKNKKWSLTELDTSPGYTTALAVEGTSFEPRLLELDTYK